MLCRKAVLSVCFLLLLMPASGWAREMKLLILHSFHAGFAWTANQQAGFLQALEGRAGAASVDLRVEYLDAGAGTFEPAGFDALFSHFKNKYTHFVPDLIYATDRQAVAFLHMYGSRLFPTVPVVFSGLHDLDLDTQLNPDRFFGTFALPDIGATVDLALRLEPTLKELHFVGDDSVVSRGLRSYVRREVARYYPQVAATFYDSPRLEDLAAHLADVQPGLWVVTSLVGVRDKHGALVSVAESLQRLSASGRFKILAMEDIYLTPGVLGGAMNRGAEQGWLAGCLAREQVFNETLPDNVSLLGNTSRSYLFDYLQLRQFGLSMEDLPPGSSVVNQPRFLWKQRGFLSGVLIGLVVLQLGFLWFLMRFFRGRGRARQALLEKQAQFHTVIAATHDAVVAIDEQGRVTLFNPAAEQLFGWSSEEMIGGSLDALMPEGYRGQHRKDVASFFGTGEPSEAIGRSLELLAIHRSGREFPVELSLSVGQCGRERFVLATLRDISSQRQVEREIRQLAYYDGLTGLPNRALFEDRFRRVLSSADRTGQLAALLFIGVDNLKIINDTRGHACGDRLLKLTGQRLSSLVHGGVTVVRWEGDKFVVLLPGLQALAEAEQVADDILKTFGEPFPVDEQRFFMTASVGVAVYPHHGSGGEMLLQHADMAMYAAKEQGRNTYCIFTEEMNRCLLERSELEHNLRQAIAREEFFLAFQPQVDQKTGRVVGAEALLRWHHKDKGLIPPGQFIPLAEESGLILPIGYWVLRHACAQNKAWQLAGYPPLRVAVNLSARQFQQPDFYDQVGRILKETELEPRYLELELTESLLMADAKAAAQTLSALRDLGVGIAIDDFGTGYSSLSYLKAFPIDRIKIAQEFVLDIVRDPGDAAIVETIIAMAHGLGLDIVAEGVETADQLEFLRTRQCQVMQGYYFSRPVPAEIFIEFLAENVAGACNGVHAML
ncbi:MAG: EAL domain-containing protein [Syntrophotalea acetylenica]|nr:EAL domain-containing protein [Syntrophotalea acetylenica]